MSRQLLDVSEHALHQSGRGLRIHDRDVVGNCVKIAQRRFRRDYFSHRSMRARDPAWLTILPSARAISPRAIPSSTAIRCCIRS